MNNWALATKRVSISVTANEDSESILDVVPIAADVPEHWK